MVVSVTPANLGDFWVWSGIRKEVHSQRFECGVVNGSPGTSVGGDIGSEVNVIQQR